MDGFRQPVLICDGVSYGYLWGIKADITNVQDIIDVLEYDTLRSVNIRHDEGYILRGGIR